MRKNIIVITDEDIERAKEWQKSFAELPDEQRKCIARACLVGAATNVSGLGRFLKKR